MPKYKPLYSLYKGLKESKYDVPDSYVSFQKTLTQAGDAGAKSRRGLYQSLKESNYDVPDTYEDFYKNLFVPVNSTTSRALKIGENPNTPAVNRYHQKLFNSVDPNKSRVSELTHRAVSQAKRGMNNVRKPVRGAVVNKQGKKVSEFDITPAKTLDDLNREYAQEVTSDWEKEQQRQSLYNTTRSLDEVQRKIAERDEQLDEADNGFWTGIRHAAQGMNVTGGMFQQYDDDIRKELIDPKYKQYLVEANYLTQMKKQLIQEEEDAAAPNATKWDRFKHASSSFTSGMLDEAFGSDAFDFGGYNKIRESDVLLRISDRINRGVATDDDRRLLQILKDKEEIESRLDNDAYSFGRGASQSAGFVTDFLITGGGDFGGLGRLGGKMALGLARKTFAKTMTKDLGKRFAAWSLKNLGKTLGEATGAAMTATSVQVGKTAANATQRYLGLDSDDGGLEYDKDGNLKFKGGTDVGTAIAKAIASGTIENYTELLGPHITSMGKRLFGWAGVGLEKITPDALSKFFDKVGSSELFKRIGTFTDEIANSKVLNAGKKALANVGVNDMPEEGLEEEAGIILNSLITGDNKFSDLWDKETQYKTWGGVMSMMGAMRAIPIAHSAVGTAYSASKNKVEYFKCKHDLTKAETLARQALGDKWTPIKELIDNADNKHIIEVGINIIRQSDKYSQEQAKAAQNYIGQLLKMRGFNNATMASIRDKNAKGEGQTDADKEDIEVSNSYAEGHEAEGELRHLIQLEYEKRTANLSKRLGLTPEKIDAMNVDSFSSYIGLNSDADFDIFQYKKAKAAYDGVMDNAQNLVDIAGEVAAQRVDNMTNVHDGTIRKAYKKGTEMNPDSPVYIISGNIKLNDDGSINYTDSDKMLVVYDEETGQREAIGNFMLASVDPNMQNAEEVKAQAIQSAKQKIITEQSNVIDGILAEGSEFTMESNDGSSHNYKIVQVDEQGNCIVSVDGTVLPEPLSLDAIQRQYDQSNVARSVKNDQTTQESEQTTQEPEQIQQESLPIGDNFDYDKITNENDGKVKRVDVTDEEGKNRFPNAKAVFLIQDKGAMPKFVVMDEEGNLTSYVGKRGDKIHLNGEMTIDEYKKQRQEELQLIAAENAESSMIEDNSGTIEADRGGIEVENNESLTFEDGTPIPVDMNGEVDLSQADAAHAAEWYDNNLGEDADDWLDGEIKKAKKVLEQAKNKKLAGTKPSELVASKKEKEAAIADAQAHYDSAISIRDSLKERRIAKKENTAEGRKELIEKARRKFARLKSAVKDDAEAVAQIYKETVGSLLHRLYDGTGIDVTDTIPLTAEEYVASNLGAHSINYEGTETSKSVKQETGLSREDFAKTQLLAADGKGTTIDALVHSLWENRPSNLDSLDTQDIRNALIGVLTSGFKASEARSFIENIRIAQAEKLIEEERTAAENAAYYEQQKAKEEEEKKKAELEKKAEEENKKAEEEKTEDNENTEFPDKLQDGSKAIEAPEDATDEKPLGEQRTDSPFSARKNGKQQTEAERAADVEKNKVDDVGLVDAVIGEKIRKSFERIAKMMGAKIQYQRTDKLGNGWIQETTDADGNVHRTIFITLDSSITEGAQFIFGHEMTHQIKNLNPAAYNELTQIVLDTYGSDAFDKAVDETMQRYSDAGFSGRARDYYAEEVVADSVGEMIRDLNLAHTLAMKMSHPLLAAIHEILQKIKLAFFGTEYSDVTKNIIRSIEQAYVKTAKGEVTNSETGEDVSFSLRQKPEPKKKGVGYKVFVLKDGKLYPPMVANPDGAATPVGVWLDADAAPIAGESKTGRPQVKQGGKGTQGGSGKLAYRPGWHLGVVPYAIQFNRKDSEGNKTLFPKNFVFAEVEYAADVDYQEEARQEGINPSGKYQHSLAGLKHLPTDGYYMYRTNPNPETDPWVITGAMKVNRILTRAEQAELVKNAGREPQQIQEGDIVTDDVVNSINQKIADAPKFSIKTYHGSQASFDKFSLRLKSAIDETETNPSDAQKESGNYKKGHIKFGGYDYTIENPKGSTRSGKDANGKEWEVTMHDTYGYIRGKFGKDGDHLDMFINDKADLDNWNGDVFVIDQVNPDGSFDEHKVMYGYDSMDDAEKAYLANYSDGWKGLGNITGASKDEFDKWLDTSNRKLKPFADYAKVKFSQAQSVSEPRYSLKDIKPVGVGAFGNIYNQFRGKAKAAIEFLKKLGSGEATAALHHHTIGDISLVWGDKKTGLDKILRKHPEVVDNLQSIIDSMEVVQESDNRIKLESPTHFAVVSKEYKGEPREQWLLTAYEKRESLENGKSMDTATSSLGGDTALSQSKESAAKIDNSSETAKENGEKFSLKDEKTMFGMHNISLDKLRKAIKQGGFAAPSMGVIDSKNGIYSGYGEITLIPKAEKIAKRTGKNIGTYAADAWTPIYPPVEKKFGGNGGDVAYDDIESVPKEMQRLTRNAINSFMDGREANGLAYLYLQEKGKAPELVHVEGKYPKELHDEVKGILGKLNGIYNTTDEQKEKLLDLFIREVYDGNKEEFDNDIKKFIKKDEEFIKKRPNSNIAKDKQLDVDWMKEHGYDYGALSRFVDGILRDAETSGKVDENATMKAAQQYIQDKGMKEDFDSWKEKLNDRYNVEEVIFAGYKPDGNRKYLPNTVENAVKVMKQDGKNASVGSASFSHFVASILKPMGTLDQIRKKKGNLTGNYEDVEKFQEKWQPVYDELADNMQPDAEPFESYGMDRLEEVATQKNPKKYAKEEYGVDLTDEDINKLNELIEAVKNDKPSIYFETKFMRPYGLDEFEKAIVPNDTPSDVVDALKMAGIDVSSYERGNAEDRQKVTMDAINSSDNIRFSLKSMMAKPEGWKQANKKAIHIAEAIERDPKFSLKNLDDTLIKAGTYFSGGGLVEEGLKGIIDPVVAVEYDEKISGVYRNNFGQHIVTADVRDVDPKELVKQIDGEVEYFHASPVCKNYSQAKSNHAEVELDKETAASTAEFINAVKPKVVTIENVKGYKDSEAMKIITDALDANGYTWDADVYNAADYGGYTNRERLIVRAVRDGKLPAKPEKMARKSGWYEAVADIIPTLTEKKNGVAPWMDIRLKADGIDWRNIDKPLYVMGSAYADGKIPHAFADELLPTLRTKSGDVIVMPDGKVYRAMGRVLARVSGVSDDYKMPFSENLSHTIIGNGIPTQLTEHVIAPLLTGSDPKFSIRTYHGTGAKFDKFDLSHALEGEGSETFGHGVYVTNSSKIGREYAQRAKRRKMADLYKNMRYPDGVKGDIFKRRVFGEMVNDVATGGSVASAKEFAKKRVGADAKDIQRTLENLKDREKGTEYEQNLKDRLAEYKEGLKWIDSIDEDYLTQGNVSRYDVDIPDDNGENYLGWNESQNFPLEKWYRLWEITHHGFSDNEYFKDGGARYDKDRIERIIQMKLDSPEKGMQNLPTLKGEELYHALEDFFDRERPSYGAELASRALSEIGFVGIKYPAGMIHGGAVEGDYNYVIFDENNANIVGNTKFSLRGSTPYGKQMEEWMEKNHLEKGAVPMEKPVMKEGENIFDYANRMVEWTRNQNLWKTAPKQTGFQDALDKWKADNGLSPDAYPPVRPHRENYSTEIGYTEDLEEYNKKKELWKSAPKPKDFDLSVDLEDMNKQLRNIRRAVLNQKNYDQRTVKAVSDLVRKMLNIGWGDGLSRGKVGNLLSAAKNATGANDVKKYLDKAMGILAENYLNRLSTAYDNLINTKGARADQSGVIKMGSLDAKGQTFMSEYKKAINMDDKSLNNYIANIEEDSAKNEDNVEMNDYRLAGIQAAIMYKQQIGGNDADIAELKRQIGELKNKKDATKEDKDLLKSLEKKLFENKFDRITLFENLLNNIQRMVKESKGRAKEFREEIAEHKNKILHRANLDLEGVDSTYYDTTTAKKKFVNNDLQRAVFSSTYTFEQFLKFFGKHSANGEGRLYNYFHKQNQDALDEEQLYNEMNRNALDEKTKELFGKNKFMKLVGIDGKGMKEMDVEVTDYSNKETGKRTIHLKQGQMLYIYLVNKETDGEMKLRAMGITEEDVAAIEENLDPRVKAMGEWLQDEYLPECQRRYQATHTKYFGAPMKEVENYFPLAINNRARNVKEDVNQDSDAMSQLAGTSTGAIVTRRVNVIPLDIENADAFEVAFNHLQEMEEWSAMLPFRQDINTLLSYTHFRNQVQNMSSVAYGSGKTLWDEFKQTAQIAAGTYKPKVNAGMMDSRIAAAMGGIAVAKISGRLWTAIKQSQSATVFLPECDFTRFVKNGVNPYGSWKWAMENIPDFRKRVENMTYGDVKLRQYLDELEKWHDWTKTISKIGMAPNILVDGITCAVGARSVYETEVNRLTKLGYPKEKAEEKAYYKAVAAYNKTQQSSGGMYLSPMQVDRTYVSAALSLFKNANFAYGRMQIEACRGLARTYDFWGGKHKTTLIESMTRQIMEEDGLDENTARAIAKATYNRTFRQSIGRLINFATLVPVSWALYKVLPYLLTGDDDDKKKDMIEEAVLKGFATSLSDNYVIPFVSNILNAGLKVEDGKPTFDPEVFRYQNLYINPATSDLANIYSMVGNQKWYSVANKLGMLGVQSLIGFNPETVGALYQALSEADYDNGNTAKEWQIGILKAISAPEESIRELYMDELGLKSGNIKKIPLAELEKRYAERQINRDNLLSQIGMDAETFNGYVDKYQKSFEKKIKDKMDKWDEYDKKKADEFFDTTSDPKLRDMIEKKRTKDANAAANEQIAKEGLNQEKKGKEPSEEAYNAVKMSIDVAEDNAISTYNKVLNKRYAALNDEYNEQTDAMKYIFMSKHPNFKAYKELESEYTNYGKKIKELKEKLVSADGYDAKQTILKQIRAEREKFSELQSKVR